MSCVKGDIRNPGRFVQILSLIKLLKPLVTLLRLEDVHVHSVRHVKLVVDTHGGLRSFKMATALHFLGKGVLLLDFGDLLGGLVDLVGAYDESTCADATDQQQKDNRENNNQTCRGCHHSSFVLVTNRDIF